MKQTLNVRTLTITALLTAVGILIPIIMPVRVVIGPASYTLGSHIPVMIAMFISPVVAAMVALGTTLGFQMAGFPFIIVLRAFSHILFAYIGAKLLVNRWQLLSSIPQRFSFSLGINLIHALGEVLVVYLATSMGASAPTENYFYTLVVLIGIGTLIHGMVDFELSYIFSKLLANRIGKRFSQIVHV